MAPQKSIFLGATALLLLLLFSSTAGDAVNVSPFCKTAENKLLCTKMVAGAHNLRDASGIAIRATLDMAKRIKGMSGSIAPSMSGLPLVSRNSVLKTCQEGLGNAVDDLQLSLRALQANDRGTLMVRLSAALNTDCQDALDEFGIVSFPLKKIFKDYADRLNSAMAVVTQQ